MKKKKLNKRVLALFMTVMMCTSVFQISAFASETEEAAAQSLSIVQEAVADYVPDTNNQGTQAAAAAQDLTGSQKTETADISQKSSGNDVSGDQVSSVSSTKAPVRDSESSGEPKAPESLNSSKSGSTDNLTNPGEPEGLDDQKEPIENDENSGSPGKPELPGDQETEGTGGTGLEESEDPNKTVNETETDKTKDPTDTEKIDGITENPAEKPADTITETPEKPEVKDPSQEQSTEQTPAAAPDNESVKEAEAKVEAAEKESAEAEESLRSAKEAADNAAAKLTSAGAEADNAAAELEKAEAEAAQAETEEEKAQAAERLSAAKVAANAALEKLSAAEAESSEAARMLQEAGAKAQAAAEKLADARKAADDIKAKLEAANKVDNNSPSGGGGGGSTAPKPEEVKEPEKPENSEVSENVKAFISLAAELSANLTKENVESAKAALAAAYSELSEQDQANEKAKAAMAELERLIKALEEPKQEVSANVSAFLQKAAELLGTEATEENAENIKALKEACINAYNELTPEEKELSDVKAAMNNIKFIGMDLQEAYQKAISELPNKITAENILGEENDKLLEAFGFFAQMDEETQQIVISEDMTLSTVFMSVLDAYRTLTSEDQAQAAEKFADADIDINKLREADDAFNEIINEDINVNNIVYVSERLADSANIFIQLSTPLQALWISKAVDAYTIVSDANDSINASEDPAAAPKKAKKMQVMAMQAETTLDSEEVIVVEENLCTAAMAFGLMRAAAGTVKNYQELVNAVNNGGNIKLGDNINVSNTINITQDVVLDLAGFAINFTAGTGSIFHVSNKATFTLKDSSGNNSGKLTGGKGTKVKWAEIVERDTANGEAAGGAVLVDSGSTFTMYGGTIGGSEVEKNSAIWGGGIAVARDGFLNIYGGNITYNTAGYEVEVTSDTLKISDISQKGKKLLIGSGGGIFCAGTGVIDPTKGGNINISNNIVNTKNDLGGGGIFIEAKGEMKVINAVVTDNTAYGLGGGVAGCLHGMISNLCPETAAVYSNTANKDASLAKITTADGEEYYADNNKAVDHDYPYLDWDKSWNVHTKDSNSDLKAANDYFCAGYSVIGPRSLNGGTTQWVGDAVYRGGNDNKKIKFNTSTDTIAVQGLLGLYAANVPELAAKVALFSDPKVTISGNKSTMHGGGIGSNGKFTFGEVSYSYSNSKITLKANKSVSDKFNSNVSKSGYSFQLKKGNTVLGTATSNNNGDIEFKELDTSIIFGDEQLTGDISAVLTLKEIAGNKPGMAYDTALRTITITVQRTSETTTIQTNGNKNEVTTNVFTDTPKSVKVSQGSATFDNDNNIITLNGNANFTNTMNYGDLKITKTVSGNTLKSDPKYFEFEVKLNHGAGKTAVNGQYNVEYTGREQNSGTVTFNDNTAKIYLKSGETATIKNLPATGNTNTVNYTVKETGTATDANDSGKNNNLANYNVTSNGSSGKIIANRVVTADFTNVRKTGNLSVTKTVKYDSDTSENPDKNTFQIAVTLMGSTDVTKIISASENSPEPVPFEGEGTYTFNLKDGQVAIIKDIPIGIKYSVIEENLSNDWKKDGEVTDNEIKEDNDTSKNNVVTITNHYFKQKTTNVTVKKQWKNEESAKMPDSVTVQLLRDGKAIEVDGKENPYIKLLSNSNAWSVEWIGLDVSAGEKSPLYTYTVKEISVNYDTEKVIDGKTYTADARTTDSDGKFTSNIIRVRSDIAAEDGSGNEIVGGWIVNDTSLIENNQPNNEVIITNTWRPAAELGNTSFTVHKIDSETEEAIEGVTFTLEKDGKVIDTQTTAKSVESGDDTDENSNDTDNNPPKTDKDGLVTFEGLTEGTYTLTEIKAPDAYDIEFDSEKNTNGNVGRTWEISIQKDGLAHVEEVPYPENTDIDKIGILGNNTWNWKPVHNDMALDPENHIGTLTVTNNVVKGNISIKKELNLLDLEGKPQDIEDNALASDLKDIEFTFNLYEGNAEVSEDGAIDAESLKTLNIKAGETAEFKDLRYGTYTIAEADPANGTNYKWADVNYSGRTEEGYKTGTVGDTNIKNAMVVNVAENGVTLAFTAVNTYNLVPGSLVIEKHVTGIDLEKFKALNDFDKLVFNVTDSNGSEAGEIFIPKSNFTVSENGEIVGYSDSDNPLNLIPGEYTITEDQNSAKINGYALKADPVKVTVKSGLVTEGDVNTASFNNEYTVNSLSIVKKIEGSNAEKFSGNTFYVDIINAETNDVVRSNVAVAGNGTAAVESELPAGNYKVVERDASQRGYRWTVTYSSDVVTIVDGGSAEVTVTNIYRRIPSDDPTPDPTPNNPQTPTTPEEPTPVVDVPDPDTPLAELPEPDVPLANIPEDDTPLSELPEDDVPLANIPDEETPLVELPEHIPLANIPDEDVPLINIIDEDVPKTGDMSLTILWIMLCLLALSGITVSSVPYLRKRRK